MNTKLLATTKVDAIRSAIDTLEHAHKPDNPAPLNAVETVLNYLCERICEFNNPQDIQTTLDIINSYVEFKKQTVSKEFNTAINQILQAIVQRKDLSTYKRLDAALGFFYNKTLDHASQIILVNAGLEILTPCPVNEKIYYQELKTREQDASSAILFESLDEEGIFEKNTTDTDDTLDGFLDLYSTINKLSQPTNVIGELKRIRP